MFFVKLFYLIRFFSLIDWFVLLVVVVSLKFCSMAVAAALSLSDFIVNCLDLKNVLYQM